MQGYRRPNKGRQLLRFEGMGSGRATPTDIDALIEYHGRVWVLFEAKYHGAEVPAGQRYALEHFVQAMRQAGRHAMAVVVDHEVQDETRDVYLRDLPVREMYTTEGKGWRPPRRPMTARMIADEYIHYWDEGLQAWA